MKAFRLFLAMSLAPFAAAAEPITFSADLLASLPADPVEGVVMYPLPRLLVSSQGTPITNASEWEAHRPNLLAAFSEHVYGHTPALPFTTTAELRESGTHQPGIRRRQVQLTFRTALGSSSAQLLIFEPAAPGPHPVFAILNLGGNPTVADDPAILPSSHVPPPSATKPLRRFVEDWPIARIVGAGYALAIIDAGDFFPDVADGYADSVQRLFPADQRGPGVHTWGAIGAWAWGLGRVADFIASDPTLDSQRLAVVGHSRLGKAALWAGATDPRFQLVISNESGCGGAALSKRIFGETVDAITRRFPHWFCGRFSSYAQAEQDLPVDQHQLLALVAPRALYVASASKDAWADPRGELMALANAASAFALYPNGKDRLGYHLRPGEHDLREYDWERFIAFANQVFARVGEGPAKHANRRE